MRSSSLAKIAAIGVVGAMALAACSNSSTASSRSSATSAAVSAAPSAAGSGAAAPSSAAGSAAASVAASGGGLAGAGGTTYKIGFEGPLSGDNQQLGINEVNAASLAVEQANAKGDLGFTVASNESDDVGAPATAPAAAAKLIQDPAVVGVIGPSFSGATKAVGKTYSDAGMAFITPSASNATLQTLGFTHLPPGHPERRGRRHPGRRLAGTQGAEEGLRHRRPFRLRQGCRRHDGVGAQGQGRHGHPAGRRRQDHGLRRHRADRAEPRVPVRSSTAATTLRRRCWRRRSRRSTTRV